MSGPPRPYLLSSAELGRLPDADQRRYLALLKGLVGGEDFPSYVSRLAPREPVPPHGKGLADIFQRSRLRQSLTMLSWPPGFGKTTLQTRGLAWWLSRSPADPCGFITYSDPKAYRHSREVMALVKRSGVMLNPAQSAAGDWQTTYGGGLFAGGWRGKGTGYRVGGFLLVDDPYRRLDDALSPAYRTSFANWLRSVAGTRLQGGSIVCSHTRWHAQDAIGEFSGTGRWRTINLPAIALPGDPLGRAVGESLWPEMFPVQSCDAPCGHAGHLDEIRELVGEWTWWALYMGDPKPLGGNIFKDEWWQFTDDLEPGESVRAWDLAATEGGHGPATVGARITRTPIGEYFIDHVFHARLSPAGVDAAILAMAKHDGHRVRISLPIDPGQAGMSQASSFGKLLDGYAFECTAEGADNENGNRSKVGRALPYASQVEQGNVFLVHRPGHTATYKHGKLELRDVPTSVWHPEWVAEHGTFPTGGLKDRVDAGSRGYHALVKLVNNEVATPPKIYDTSATGVAMPPTIYNPEDR